MAANFRAFVLAGTGSGCGKTTVTLGLLSLLKNAVCASSLAKSVLIIWIPAGIPPYLAQPPAILIASCSPLPR